MSILSIYRCSYSASQGVKQCCAWKYFTRASDTFEINDKDVISQKAALFFFTFILAKLTYGSAHQGLDPQRHAFHKLLRSLDGPLEKHRDAVKHQEGRSHSLALLQTGNETRSTF